MKRTYAYFQVISFETKRLRKLCIFYTDLYFTNE